MFATHYHELTELARSHPRTRNLSVAVKEWNNTIIFLHKLVKGGTSRSYGIQVAALAGVPADVVNRAEEILKKIIEGQMGKKFFSQRCLLEQPFIKDDKKSVAKVLEEKGLELKSFVYVATA